MEAEIQKLFIERREILLKISIIDKWGWNNSILYMDRSYVLCVLLDTEKKYVDYWIFGSKRQVSFIMNFYSLPPQQESCSLLYRPKRSYGVCRTITY